MKILVWLLATVLVFALASPSNALQRTRPDHSPRTAHAIDGVIQQRVNRMGIEPDDPRYIGTRGAVMGGLGTAAAAAGLATVGAITWPAVLIAAGIGTVAGGAVALLEYGADRWLFGETAATPAAASDPALLPTGWWYSTTQGSRTFFFQSAGQCTAIFAPMSGNFTCTNGVPNPPSTMTNDMHCRVGPVHSSSGFPTLQVMQRGCSNSSYPHSVIINLNPSFRTTQPLPGQIPTVPALSPVAPGDMHLNYTPEQLRQPVAPTALAAAANTAWRNAGSSAPIPWSAADPIRPEEVEQWRAANPQLWPTVGDFLSPIGPGDGRTLSSPVGVPGVDSSTWPGRVPPSPSAPSPSPVDFGPDPNIRGLDLQEAPTPQAILAPILSLMPDLRSYTVDLSPRSCPVVSIELFGTRYTMDAQCSLIAPHEALLRALAIFAWTLLAVLIVLRA